MSLLHNQVNPSMHCLSDCTCFLRSTPTIRSFDSLLRSHQHLLFHGFWTCLSSSILNALYACMYPREASSCRTLTRCRSICRISTIASRCDTHIARSCMDVTVALPISISKSHSLNLLYKLCAYTRRRRVAGGVMPSLAH